MTSIPVTAITPIRMTTLENSYCVPMTVKECEAIGVHVGCIGYAVMWDPVIDGLTVCEVDEVGDDTRNVSVVQYLDLMHDRIVPWRLEEVGFRHTVRGIYEYFPNYHGHSSIEYCDGFVYVSAGKTSITTFTDLLQLIGFLTPPSK